MLSLHVQVACSLKYGYDLEVFILLLECLFVAVYKIDYFLENSEESKKILKSK